MASMHEINVLRTFIPNEEDALLNAYLNMAESKILNKMYPFGIPDDVSGVPDRYFQTQINIAIYLYSKRGAEGETQHDENGINRAYESADVPKSMLKEVHSFVGVI